MTKLHIHKIVSLSPADILGNWNKAFTNPTLIHILNITKNIGALELLWTILAVAGIFITQRAVNTSNNDAIIAINDPIGRHITQIFARSARIKRTVFIGFFIIGFMAMFLPNEPPTYPRVVIGLAFISLESYLAVATNRDFKSRLDILNHLKANTEKDRDILNRSSEV
jgi:hypothetical protein